MKTSGDLTPSQREHVENLTKYEQSVDDDLTFSKEKRAQLYVCVAHDYYQLDMDEEGNRLLLKAEDACPGYFKTVVIQHQLESPNFDRLIKNLTIELLYLFTENLRNK